MRKREVILLNQLILKILRLKYLKALSAGFVVLLANIFTLTMVTDAPSLSVRSALLYSQVHPRHRNRTHYSCPHCGHSLYLWKERRDISIYKCDNERRPHFSNNKLKLNCAERLLAKVKSSQFKLRYQYREYHFTQEKLKHSAPEEKDVFSLSKIYNSLNTLCLALTFHISLGISARKTVLKKRGHSHSFA